MREGGASAARQAFNLIHQSTYILLSVMTRQDTVITILLIHCFKYVNLHSNTTCTRSKYHEDWQSEIGSYTTGRKQ